MVASFLSSCVGALEAERTMSRETPVEALSREIAGIDSVLSKYSNDLFALHTLLLTKAFYMRIREYNPLSATDVRDAVPLIVDQVISEISSVHVEEVAQRLFDTSASC
jgi:hypothetical protein